MSNTEKQYQPLGVAYQGVLSHYMVVDMVNGFVMDVGEDGEYIEYETEELAEERSRFLNRPSRRID